MFTYSIRISLSKPSANSSFAAYTSKSLFSPLLNNAAKASVQQSSITGSHHPDFRFGPIRIDWMDVETSESESQRRVSVSGKERARTHTRGTASATFVPNSKSRCGTAQLPAGIVHVYRDAANAPSDAEFPALPNGTMGNAETDGVMLAVLAVPAWMTPSDFLAFVSPAAEGISHLRIIRDSAPNRSIAVVKFRKGADAAEFAEAYNGKAFNSIEPEICNVVHVSSVSIDEEDSVSITIDRLANGTLQELPTCPVCLERMDSAVTGLVTVPCSHTFHCTCLSKWGDSRCPVCRYSQTLRTAHPTSSALSRAPALPASAPSTSACSDPACRSTTNLWICLICGNVGCGRYGRAHAHEHYTRTMHLYALELETQRVWDYAGDGYVHRLIQNKADGKLVELPSASMSGSARDEGRAGTGPGPADTLSAEKIEKIGIEYSYLLTSQLDSQRDYYEALRAEDAAVAASLHHQVAELKAFFSDKETRQIAEETERTTAIEREKIRTEKRLERMTELARRFEKELKEEKAVSVGLMENMAKARERADQAEQEQAVLKAKVTDLEDQIRDVMFFLEAKTKIEEGEGITGELAGGSIELPPAARTGAKKKKGKK